MPKTVLESLNAGLHGAFAADPTVYLLGEDVLDPYGGAFKVTRGLSDAYPDRVFTTPISEAGIVGVGAGMALRGLRPVVEIMFGDFLALAADQLVNHVAKFRWMYHGGSPEGLRLPLVVRTPMGGRRGYGPTHSQTLEKLFMGVPGLRLLASCAFSTGLDDGPGELLKRMILETDRPTIFIENKLLYLERVLSPHGLNDFDLVSFESPAFRSASGLEPQAPGYLLRLRNAPPASITLTAYGYMAELARQACLRLAYEHEIFTELVVQTQLSPFQGELLLDSVSRTRRLVTVEEGTLSLGWGAEVLARLAERRRSPLQSARRLAASNTPVPASPALEMAALPGVEEILKSCLELVQNG